MKPFERWQVFFVGVTVGAGVVNLVQQFVAALAEVSR